MFEDIMCLMAGFITSYLILRAVRSFRGGVGVLLCGFGGLTAVGQTLHVHNTSGGSIGISYYKDGVFFGGPQSLPNGQTSTYYGNAPCSNCGSHVWSARVAGVEIGSLTVSSANGCCAAEVWWEYGPPLYDAVVCSSGWVNTLDCCVSLEVMATNTVYHTFYNSTRSQNVCPGDSMPAFCVTNVLGTDANGSGIPFRLVIVRSGCQGDDYIAKTLVDDESSNQGKGGAGPSEGPPPVDEGNPPDSVGDTNRTSDQSLHDDLMNLTRLGAKEAKQDMQLKLQEAMVEDLDLLELIDTRLTDQIDQGTVANGLLGDVKTNTAAMTRGVDDLGRALIGWTDTNGFHAGVLTANDGGSVSNAFLNGSFGSLSNLAQGTVSGNGVGGLTNGLGRWNTSAPSSEGTGMQLSLFGPGGVVHVIDFNIFNRMEGLTLVLLQWMPFIRKWLAWGMTITLFWLVTDRIDECMKSQNAGLTSAKGGGGGVIQYGVRLASAPLIITVVGGLLAVLPVATVAALTTWGFSAPWSVEGLFETAVGDAPVGRSAQVVAEFMGGLMVFIPFDVLTGCMIIWPLVYFFTQFYINLVCLLLYLTGILAPCVAVLVGPWLGGASQVRFENLSGAPVVVSNEYQILSLPAGVSEKLVLSPGNWVCGTNGFTVDLDGYQVVRVYGDTNGVPAAFAQARGYSGYGWFMWGMNSGFLIFGTAWAVSCARSGILLRVRE